LSDNVSITAGSGTSIATDDVGGVQYQRVKISLGADGAATDALGGAGAVADGVQRVTLASDDPAVSSLASILSAVDGLETLIAATNTAVGSVATQTTLAALLAKVIAAPATEAKQDTGNTSLASIVTLLTTQAGYLDGLEGYVDGIETLIGSTNSKLDTLHTDLGTTLAGYVDGLETLNGAVNETAPATDTASSGLNGRLQRIAQRLTSLIALLPTSLGANGGLKIEGVASGTTVPVSGTVTTTNATLTDVGAGEYETVAASQTDQALGATGATGDYLAGVLIVPATTSPGAVSIKDGAGSSITVFTGGASSVSNLVPFFVPLGLKSASGAWKVTTGTNVSAIGTGNFT